MNEINEREEVIPSEEPVVETTEMVTVVPSAGNDITTADEEQGNEGNSKPFSK